MKFFIDIYCLKTDTTLIKSIQKASIDKTNNYGYKIENGLLFGTVDWFKAIETGQIEKHIIRGVISRTYMSGHNDYPEFELENEQGKTVWTRKGIDSAYQVGKNIELVYVKQKYKRPSSINGILSNCILEIRVSA